MLSPAIAPAASSANTGAGAAAHNAVQSSGLVFLLDVDNTLLDNDRFCTRLGDHLDQRFGAAQRARYWTIFSKLRDSSGLADYLGTLQAFRAGLDDDPQLLQLSQFLLEFPFETLVYPPAMDVIAHLAALGTTVILSDGDVVFQPRKIRRSGIWDAVDGRVLVYVHKERALRQVLEDYPAEHYVMVDDKPNLLAAMKTVLGAKLTTVFVRQGHCALDAQSNTYLPPPDRVIDGIGELTALNSTDFEVFT